MEWFYEISIVDQLMQYKELLEALKLTKIISREGRRNHWLIRFNRHSSNPTENLTPKSISHNASLGNLAQLKGSVHICKL